MSHHYSGPDFGFPQGDARLDFTDLYAFPKPGEIGKSILIMNVHPSAGENPPGPTTTEPFAPEAVSSSRLIPMVMRLLISPTECASPLSSAAYKPRASVALMARKPQVPAMAGE
jgi:hypothetical protein